MLRRPLAAITFGALLGSREVAAQLLKQLTDDASELLRGPRNGSVRGVVVEAMCRAMDTAWPRRFRLNELESIAELLCPPAIFETGKLPLLDEAFDSVMSANGLQIGRRPDASNGFAELASEFDPILLAAWRIAGSLSNPAADGDIPDYTSLFDFFESMPGHADNHVHLGGVSAHEFVLARQLFDVDVSRDSFAVWRRLRELVAFFMQIGANESLRSDGSFAMLRRTFAAAQGVSAPLGVDWESIADAYPAGMATDTEDQVLDWLRGSAARAVGQGQFSRAWLLVAVLLFRVYRHASTTVAVRIAVLYFIVELMAQRRSLLVDGQGLRRFTSRYYSASARKGALDNGSAHSRDSIERLFVAMGDRAELKVSPGAFRPELARRIAEAMVPLAPQAAYTAFDALIRGCEAWTNEVAVYAATLERWHACAHFIRGAPPKRGGRRSKRKELWREAKAVRDNVRSRVGWNFARLLGGSANAHLDFHPGRWLRALDVAGDETAWPIEYFAPQLRWLRAELEGRALLGATDSRALLPDHAGPPAKTRIHLSIHAGEDYDHPLSGLRHVDETIRFCEMRRGDRLGHALALGIDPGRWMKDHGEVLIPLEVHVDNLVWCWHHACALAPTMHLAAQVRQEVEARILALVPEIERVQALGARPQELFEAWVLRRNCPIRLEESSAPAAAALAEVAVAVPDFARLVAPVAGDVAAALYRARVLEEASLRFDPRARAAPRMVLVRSNGESRGNFGGNADLLHDEESENMLLFMHALQDLLLDACAQKGICIETNPTSNVYIARLDRFAEHPIFRWDPPNPAELSPGAEWNKWGLRRKAVPVLINTDDPGIMPTTLRLEYALIEDAARTRYTPAQVDHWMRKLRVRGMRVFRVNHSRVFRPIG